MALLKVSSLFVATAVKDTIQLFLKASGTWSLDYQHIFNKDVSKDEVIDFIIFSPSGKYFLALYSDKQLFLWKMIHKENVWKKIQQISLNRRSTSAAFSLDETEIYVADKSGDVFKYSLPPIGQDGECVEKEESKSILGHVSILLDICVTEKYIVTADRDEKIRVSLKDKPYVIQSFCLGHTDFVCKLIPLENNCLISSSGDGTLSIWNMEEGLNMCNYNFSAGVFLESIISTDISQSKQSAPALFTYNLSLKLLAVGTVGLNDNIVYIFQVSLAKPYLAKCYEIIQEKDQHFVDIAFDCSESETVLLYALLQCNDRLKFAAFSCDSTSYDTVQSDILSDVNSKFVTLPVDDMRQLRYLQLFKTTVPGHAYDAFYEKKNMQFKKEKKSKKAKLEE